MSTFNKPFGGGSGNGGGGGSSETPIQAYNALTNTPDLDLNPSGIKAGDRYLITVAGNFFTEAVAINTILTALQNDPTALIHWSRTVEVDINSKADTDLQNLTPTALSDLNLRTGTQINTSISTATGGLADKALSNLSAQQIVSALSNLNLQTKDATTLEISSALEASGHFQFVSSLSSSDSIPSSTSKGDFYTFSQDRTFLGVTVKTGDSAFALVNNASTTVLSGNWHLFVAGSDGGGGGGVPEDGSITATKLDVSTPAKIADFISALGILSASSIVSSLSSKANTNASNINKSNFLSALNVEDGADVTDASNIASSGGVLHSNSNLTSSSFFLDEDDLDSDDATKVASQQSIKAYVGALETSTGSLLGSKANLALSNLQDFSAARSNLNVNSGAEVDAKVSAEATLRSNADTVLNNLVGIETWNGVDGLSVVIYSTNQLVLDTLNHTVYRALNARQIGTTRPTLDTTNWRIAHTDTSLSNLSDASAARSNLSVDSISESSAKLALKLNISGAGLSSSETDTLVNALEVRRRFVEQRTFNDDIDGYNSVEGEVIINYINKDLQVGQESFTHDDATGIMTCTKAGFFNFKFKISFTGATANRVFLTTFFSVQRFEDSSFTTIEESKSTDYSRVPFSSVADKTPMASTMSDHIILMAIGDQVKFSSHAATGSALNNAIVRPSGSSLQIIGV